MEGRSEINEKKKKKVAEKFWKLPNENLSDLFINIQRDRARGKERGREREIEKKKLSPKLPNK